jgi:hypothetical protein
MFGIIGPNLCIHQNAPELTICSNKLLHQDASEGTVILHFLMFHYYFLLLLFPISSGQWMFAKYHRATYGEAIYVQQSGYINHSSYVMSVLCLPLQQRTIVYASTYYLLRT